MKKLKNSGFTLIELLAVITIMGILMMVAIPAVSRTIENSRRDTFASIVHEYVSAVRNAYLGDNMKCYSNGKWIVASATPIGTYYVPICTLATDCDAIKVKVTENGAEVEKEALNGNQINQSTKDLLEQGGKSSFGNADMKGYIKITKVANTETDTETGKVNRTTKLEYRIKMIDSGLHGISGEILEEDVDRSSVETNIVLSDTVTRVNVPGDVGAIPCKVA